MGHLSSRAVHALPGLACGAAVLIAATPARAPEAGTRAVQTTTPASDRRGACRRGVESALAARTEPLRLVARVLAILHDEHEALFEACGRDDLEAAILLVQDARTLAACRATSAAEVPCERLLRELRLYREGDASLR